jgi:hypothetical protein
MTARLRLKATIATAALLLSATGHATEVRSGYWTVFDGNVDGNGRLKPLCGMKTVYGVVNASIIVKYILGDKNLIVHIFKAGWRFPEKAITFPITLGFNKEVWGHTTALGVDNPKAGPMVEFYVATEATDRFLKAFGEAEWMWIGFDEGSEKPWPAKMGGSRNAASMFGRCVTNLINANSTQPYGKPETQPYSNSATQPYGNSQTQPYSAAPPSQPNGAPAGKPVTLPSAKKDDGTI